MNWILDADIKGFFDAVNQDWLIRFLEHRIGDERITRLVKKWLKAGVLEEGQWQSSDMGTPQGADISPLLVNIDLHYVFDLWVKQWRKREAKGKVIVVRYADDIVAGFELESDARRFWDAMRERFEQLGKLHLIINHLGELLGIKLTACNVDDRKALKAMDTSLFGKLFGDKGYIAEWLNFAKNAMMTSSPRLGAT